MTIKSAPPMVLPPIPVGLPEESRRYFEALHRTLQAFALTVYQDLAQGESTLTTFTAAPTTNDVDENQVVLRTDAGNQAFYVNVGGTIMSTALS